jgi:hypothetical protein
MTLAFIPEVIKEALAPTMIQSTNGHAAGEEPQQNIATQYMSWDHCVEA